MEGAPSSIPRVLKKGRGVKRIKPSPGVSSDTDALKIKTTAKTTANPSRDGYAETKRQRRAEVKNKTTKDTTIQEDRLGVLPAQRP